VKGHLEAEGYRLKWCHRGVQIQKCLHRNFLMIQKQNPLFCVLHTLDATMDIFQMTSVRTSGV